MNKEYNVVYVKLNSGQTIKIGLPSPSSQGKSVEPKDSDTERKRHDKLKEEILYAPPEGLIVPMRDGTYQLVEFTEEERDQLAKDLWPSRYKKAGTNNNKEESK